MKLQKNITTQLLNFGNVEHTQPDFEFGQSRFPNLTVMVSFF